MHVYTTDGGGSWQCSTQDICASGRSPQLRVKIKAKALPEWALPSPGAAKQLIRSSLILPEVTCSFVPCSGGLIGRIVHAACRHHCAGNSKQTDMLLQVRPNSIRSVASQLLGKVEPSPARYKTFYFNP